MKTLFYCLIYPLLALLDIVFTWAICAALVNWWAPLLALETVYSDRGVSKTGYKLPSWLAWCDTFDADLDQGVRDGTIVGTSTYWNRVKWLYRNCGYGFSYWAIGADFVRSDWRVVLWRERPDRLTFIAVSQSGHFNILVTRYGLRVKLGWKAWNYYDTTIRKWSDQPWGPDWRVPFVFSVSLA